ncbi:MAG: hypothetical protein OHK0046_09920 [Anaerolineae bacterium]
MLKRYLLEPFVDLNSATQERAQIVTVLSLLVVIFHVFIYLFLNAFSSPAAPTPSFAVFIALNVGMLFAYILSRWGYFRIAAGLVITLIILPNYSLVSQNGLDTLVYTVPGVMIACVTFSPLVGGIITAINLAVILLLPVLIPGLSPTVVMLESFSQVFVLSVAVVINFALLQRQRERQQQRRDEEVMRFRRLVDFHPNMIAVHADGHYLYINPAGVTLLGLPDAKAVIGRPISDFMHPEYRASVSAKVMRMEQMDTFAMRTGERLVRADGRAVDVEVTSIPVIYQGKLATQIIVQDFSEISQIANSLRESEERYLTIAELISDYAYQIRLEGEHSHRLMWLRGRFEQTTAYNAYDVAQWQNLNTLVHPDDLARLQQHWLKIQQGQANISEYRICTKTDKIRWVRDYARPLYDESNTRVTGITAVVQDVTERLQAELALKAHALQQAVVAELGQRALNNILSVEQLAEEALTLIAQVLNLEYCRLLEYDALQRGLTYRASIGWPPEMPTLEPVHSASPGSQAVYTFLKNAPVIQPDLKQERRFRIDTLPEDAISGVSVMVHGHDGPLGVLEAYTTHKRTFTLDDVNFVQSMANVLAAFIEQRRTRAAEEEQRTVAEALANISSALNSTLQLDEVLDRILVQLSRIVRYDAASIMLVEGEEAHVIRYVGYKQRDGSEQNLRNVRLPIESNAVLTEMVTGRKPVIIADVRQTPAWYVVPGEKWQQAYLGAPIFFENEMIGIINVDGAENGMFTRIDSQRLQAFAHQASIAIRNARRTTELERRVVRRTVELEVERGRLQAILDATGEGIFYTEGPVIRYANEALCHMTGYKSHELEGCSTAMLFADSEDNDLEKWATVQKVIHTGSIWRDEMTLRRKNGSTFHASLTISLAQSTDGAPRTVTLVRDISQEKALDAQKQRFIASASHELRAPIASLNTRLYLVRRDPDHAERHLAMLEQIIDQMNRLVEDLLDVSRFETGTIHIRPRNLVLQKLVRQVIDIQQPEAQRKHITLNLNEMTDPLHVFVDPDRVTQVITNIVANAINYTAEGGTIDVMLSTQASDNTMPYAVIAVRDTGVGIAENDLPHIFQPFFRASESTKGTGLGLSIAREIVTLHNGQIDVQSKLGEGSTFFIRLPLVPSVIE